MTEMRTTARKPLSTVYNNGSPNTPMVLAPPGRVLRRQQRLKVRRQRHTHKTIFMIIMSITFLFIIVCFVVLIRKQFFAGEDDDFGAGSIRRRNRQNDKLHPDMTDFSLPNMGMDQFARKQFQLNDDEEYNTDAKANPQMPKTDKEKETLILEGKVHLFFLSINKRKLQKESYEGITGHFCFLDWERYREDPSTYPMFRDLTNRDCTRNSFTYDLHKIVKLATAYDSDKVHAIEPSGFIFHESRCGSTLVANALTAMSSTEHLVYSESQPPIQAIKACGLGGKECPPYRAIEIFQDVVYIMGRTKDSGRTKLFFKIQSIGTKYMDIAIDAFPNTPWVFVYRDPVQIMMSQFKMGIHAANCVRQLVDVDVPDKIMESLIAIGRKVRNLDPYEKCAFHLSTLCETAIEAIGNSNGMGIGINYKDLINKLIDTVFPYHFGLEMTEESKERIIEVSGHYSKGRGRQKGKEWKEDSIEKDQMATPKIKEACETFLYPGYNFLEKVS